MKNLEQQTNSQNLVPRSAQVPDQGASPLPLQGERLPIFRELITRFAIERGQIRAESGDNTEKLRVLDNAFYKDLTHWKEFLHSSPLIIETLYNELCVTELKARLARFEENFTEIAFKLGVLLPRELPGKDGTELSAEAPSRNLREYLKTQSDLTNRFPGLKNLRNAALDEAVADGLSARIIIEKAVMDTRFRLPFIIGPFKRDGEALWNILLQTGIDSIPYVSGAFESRRHKNLEEIIEKKTEGYDRSRLLNLLDGKYTEALADNIAYAIEKNLNRASYSAGEDKKMYLDLLQAVRAIPDEMLTNVEKDLLERHGRALALGEEKPKNFKDLLTLHIPGVDRVTQICARMQGDKELSAAIQFCLLLEEGNTKNLVKALKILEVCSEVNINIKNGFSRTYKNLSLEEHIKSKIPEGYLRDTALALLRSDDLAARYAKLCYGLSSLKREWIGEAFRDTTPDERKQLKEMHKTEFGKTIMERLNIPRMFFLKFRQGEFIESIIENGALLPWEQARYAMVGMWTDVYMLKNVFIGNTKAENDYIDQKYKEKFYKPNDLITGLAEEHPSLKRIFFTGIIEDDIYKKEFLSADSKSDIAFARLGIPANDKERYDRLVDRIKYEESGHWYTKSFRWVSKMLFRGDISKNLVDDVSNAKAMYEKAISGKNPFDYTEKAFGALVEIAELELDVFRRMKALLSPIIPNTVSAALTFATLTTLAYYSVPWPACILAAISVGLTSVRILKRRFLGAAYAARETFFDQSLSVISATSFYILPILTSLYFGGLGGMFTTKVIRGVTKQGVMQTVKLIDRLGHRRKKLFFLNLDLDLDVSKSNNSVAHLLDNSIKGRGTGGNSPLDQRLRKLWDQALHT
jgi:hypothetical protein